MLAALPQVAVARVGHHTDDRDRSLQIGSHPERLPMGSWLAVVAAADSLTTTTAGASARSASVNPGPGTETERLEIVRATSMLTSVRSDSSSIVLQLPPSVHAADPAKGLPQPETPRTPGIARSAAATLEQCALLAASRA